VKYLGNSPHIRVLDCFIANGIYDCSLQDVADATELSRNTVRKIIKEMLELEIIKPTGNVGRAKMFRINKGNEYVRHLIKLDFSLSKQYCGTLERKFEATAEK
jgi:MarR-like DNA-binding transcriptional regulator SgrR of sgrS sRNA